MRKYILQPMFLLTAFFLCGIFRLSGQEFINGGFEDNSGIEGINLTIPGFTLQLQIV